MHIPHLRRLHVAIAQESESVLVPVYVVVVLPTWCLDRFEEMYSLTILVSHASLQCGVDRGYAQRRRGCATENYLQRQAIGKSYS